MAASNAADGIQFAIDSSILPKDINPGKVDPHRENFDLRQYIDFNIKPEDLHKCWLSPYNKPCNGNWDEFYNAWKRVQIPYLDCNDFGDTLQTMSNDTRIAYQQQHNGLCELRHAFRSQGDAYIPSEDFDCCPGTNSSRMRMLRSPSKEAVHHFAYRLISMVQKQEQAVLGKFDGGVSGGNPGKWWIAPPNESIELPSVETPDPTPDKAQPDGGVDGLTGLGTSDQARLKAADYTVHWVCYQRRKKGSLANDDNSQNGTENSHLAVIIRERATGNTWYFDSLNTPKDDATVNLDEKHQSVLSSLHKWLSKNKIGIPAVPNGNRHRRVQVIPQDLPWACGLHAIAHALAFLRFGFLGWHEIPTYVREKTDKAKLTKLRHDMMKAMELSMGIRPPPRVDANKIPLPEHYDDELDLSTFRFPTYRSVGVKRKEDLYNCEEPPFTHDLEQFHEDILREKYGRVHIECYDGISLQDKSVDLYSYKVYSELHNGLRAMRNGEWLSDEQVHYHATRLMTKVQEQAGADLGPARAENQDWWIAPDAYVIRCQKNKTTGENEDQQEWINALSVVGPAHQDYRNMGEAGDRSKDKEKFDCAKYTIHWVHHSYLIDHWGVIVREKATNFAWYFDSMEAGRQDRKTRAIKVFNEWLVKCRPPNSDVPKEVTQSFLVPAPEQSSGWECGLHAIAHAVAFIRFGILGWHALPIEAIALDEGPKGTGDQTAASAPLDPSERLCETMTSALHGLMGISLPSPTSKDDGNGTAEAVSDSNGNTNSNSADKTNAGSSKNPNSGPSGKSNQGGSGPKPSDAMATSSQPPGKNPAVIETIPRHNGYKHAVPHPKFFNKVQYEGQGPGFRFPTYPSIPLAAKDVRSVNQEPFNGIMSLDRVDAYNRVSVGNIPQCCDRVKLGSSPYAKQAFADINDALLNTRRDEWLEGKGMYHLASRLITYVQKQDRDAPPLGPFDNGHWWIAPHPFIIDVPNPGGNPNLQPARTFSDIDQGVWGFDSSDFGEVEERLFDQARYTVHFIHHPVHWTVIVREAATGHLWHFDSLERGLGRFRRAIDAFEDWLRRCHKPILATSQAFQVPITLQTKNWECSLHSIANAMAMLRFGILGWDKLQCLALETDPDPVAPADSVTADNLREIMKRSLHGIFGLMLDGDVANVAEKEKQEKADEDELKAMQDDSLMDKANMSFDAVIDTVTNNPDELHSLNQQEREAREAREKKRKEQKEKDQREMKERFRRAQAERDRKAREEQEKEKEKEKEKEAQEARDKEAQEARDKEEQEKLNQQQGASNSRKRGAADDDDDESSGRSSKRSKPTPEENPTENPAQSPNNKRKTPPPDTQTKPAKRARREPTPAPQTPARKSERQRKATEKAAEAAQKAEAARKAEAAQKVEAAQKLEAAQEEAEAAQDSEDDVVEIDWREARRARLKAMGMTRLIEECKRRLLAGPGDEHKQLTYSAHKTLDGLVDRLMWYDEPEGYEEDLEGKSLKELKEMCKETYELRFGGTNAELMKDRLRWFYAEQQRHVQTLIEEGEIPANWNGEDEGESDWEEDGEGEVVKNEEVEGENRERVEENRERGDNDEDKDEEYSEDVSEEP